MSTVKIRSPRLLILGVFSVQANLQANSCMLSKLGFPCSLLLPPTFQNVSNICLQFRQSSLQFGYQSD